METSNFIFEVFVYGLPELPTVKQTHNDSTRNLYHVGHELNQLFLVQDLWLSVLSVTAGRAKQW